MFGRILTKIFGTNNERVVKKLWPTVSVIQSFEPQFEKLSDAELRAKTQEFRARIAERLNGITEPDALKAAEKAALDELLPEAFAVVREAGRRAVKMRHFDVQMIGGMVLHQGKISEMRTGEGKTLVATLSCYLNALAGHGVHVVTVNDYLAKRDAEWMGKIYEFLGMTVGVIVHDLSDDQRREAYAADITYGTNNEFGFDYLRDNMKFDIKDCVQRGHYYAIVDEVDSILIDESRTPLIISGPTDQTTDKYARVRDIIPKLELGEEVDPGGGESKIFSGDYVVDEKHRTIGVTDEGWITIEKMLGIDNIADPENWDLKHYVETGIKAHSLYKRDVDYVVKEGEVIIVDTFTGRLMPGRRWSDGLHQSIEAKEGVNIRKEDQTLATITFQNYFRLYQKLSGMTGTAETEAAEFDKIYKLEITVIPTNKPMLREDASDIVYRTIKEKYKAVADDIAAIHETGQPVLVGTTSIEKSELLSQTLQRKGVKHVVLNAKFHEREAEIVAQAGRLGMVTIATNMAGRGTDILLGGNAEFMIRQELVKKGLARALSVAEGAINPMAPAGFLRFYYQGQEFETSEAQWQEINQVYAASVEDDHNAVIAAGGLFILGTERHESRRIDNQLRGRAGRQGDPGASRFYLSLEDDLMRIFAKAWVSTLLERLGMEEGVPIESNMISKRIEGAQKAVESQNFESRKHLLEYDDVMNKQREAVYGLRKQLLMAVEQRELILEDYLSNLLSTILDQTAPEAAHIETWDLKAMKSRLTEQFGFDLEKSGLDHLTITRHELGEGIYNKLRADYETKEKILGTEAMRYHERMVMLSVIDGLWKDHLLSMDHLKEGINLRGYAQQDPLVAYKRESFDMFEAMMLRFQEDTARFLFRMQIVGPDGQPWTEAPAEILEIEGKLAEKMDQEIPAAPPVESAEPQLVGATQAALPRSSERARQLSAQSSAQPAGRPPQQPPRQSVPPASAPPSRPSNGAPPQSGRPPVQVPTRPPSTTIDALEREFERKKQRELEAARMAGGSATSSPSPRNAGSKVGRNDPCPCGSGKKFKKCHGTDASA